jgi:hypothetical protein
VPGTRTTSRSIFGSSAIGTARRCSSVRSSARPSRQVTNTANIAADSASGIQPPLGILVALPSTKARSTMPNSPNTATTRQTGHFHAARAAMAPSSVVITMVPFTAAPYAPESALEPWKITTKAQVAKNMNALVDGT